MTQESTKLLIFGREVELPADVAAKYVRMEIALSKAVEVRQWQKAYFLARKKGESGQGTLVLSKEAERDLDKLLEEFTPALEPRAQAAGAVTRSSTTASFEQYLTPDEKKEFREYQERQDLDLGRLPL